MAENTSCDHYFQDSKWCLLCGWVPPMADGTPRYRLAGVGIVVSEDALIASKAQERRSDQFISLKLEFPIPLRGEQLEEAEQVMSGFLAIIQTAKGMK